MATSRYIIQKENKLADNKLLLPLLIAFFFIFGTAFSYGGFDYGRFFTAALIGITLLLDIEDSFCTIIFAFAFSSMLKFAAGTISMMPVLYLVLLLKILAKGKLSVPPVSLFCFFAFALLQGLCIVIYDAPYAKIISTLLNVAFVTVMAGYFSENKATVSNLLVKASVHFLAGTTVMLILSDIFPHLGKLVHPSQYATITAANRYAATVLDPNELSQIILIAIGLGVAILPTLQTKFGKLLTIASLIYIGLTGIRTNSKSYVITILIVFVFLMFIYIYTTAKRDGLSKTVVKLLPILIITIISLTLMVIYVVIPVFESRGVENASFLTNRDNIWRNYLGALSQRLDVAVLGCGGGNVTKVMSLVGRESHGVPHNSYLEYLIQFGIIGVFFMSVAWKNAFNQLKDKLTSYYSIALISFLITAFSISINSSDCPFILLALLSLPMPENTVSLREAISLGKSSNPIQNR